MRVFLTGATGVLGQASATRLVAAGHTVTGVARTPEKAALLRNLGVTPVAVDVLNAGALADRLRGHDAACNLMTAIPVGWAALRPGAWKVSDQLRTEGSQAVVAAASAAGVRRLVQESVSLLYADGGDAWITEDSPLSVSRGLDPVAVAESTATRFGGVGRDAVVLRFGLLVGDDPLTRWQLTQARAGRPVGLGDPRAWATVVHPHDAGAAVVAALEAPAGIYNVGAEPVRRAELAASFAAAVGRETVGFVPKLVVRLGGDRLAALARSHRVSATRLREATGWAPARSTLDASWLTGAELP